MPITPLAGAILGCKMSRNIGKYEESGGEKDKYTEEDRMPRHEKHPPFRWVPFWGIFYCKTGDVLRFWTQTCPPGGVRAKNIYTEQMDVAVLGDRLPEVTRKPFLGSSSLSLQCRHWGSSKVLGGLVLLWDAVTVPTVCLSGFSEGWRGGGGSAAVCDPNPPRPFARSRK